MKIVNVMNSYEVPTYSELVPYVGPNMNFKSTIQPRGNVPETTNALQAVKLDPAVLEVRVTINSGLKEQDGLDTASSTVSESSSKQASFKEMVMLQQAALLSLKPEQYELLMKFASTLRRQRHTNQMNLECAFCKNNGESLAWYSSHALKNWRGRVQCPVLRAYHCPRCGATGDRAHTIKYCGLDSPPVCPQRRQVNATSSFFE